MDINKHVLVDENFIKSLPKGQEKRILSHVKSFLEDLRSNDYDLHKISFGYSVRRVKNTDVFKFRSNDNARILFRFLPTDIDGLRRIGIRAKIIEEYQLADALILLRYCEHDEAIRIARRFGGKVRNVSVINFDDRPDITEDVLEQHFDGWVYDKYNNYTYRPEKQVIQIVGNDDLPNVVEMNKAGREFYLNDEQYNVLQRGLPILLFGCAGSGKTTLNIYKLYELLARDDSSQIGYFTYSALLRDEVREGLECFLAHRGQIEKIRRVDFWNVREYLIEASGEARLVHYEQFAQWFNKQTRYKRLDVFAVWREIRGIIKGLAGRDIDFAGFRHPGKTGRHSSLMPLDEYLNLGDQFSVFDRQEKEIIHSLAETYSQWLWQERLCDINDLAAMAFQSLGQKKLPRYDYIIIDEVQDLTEKELVLLFSLLKNPLGFFVTGDVNQTVNATYFAPHRIYSLFMEKAAAMHEADYRYTLHLDYRCSPLIVEASNALIDIRKKALKGDKHNWDYDEYDIAVTRSEDSYFFRPTLLRLDESAKHDILKIVPQRHYAAIVVSDAKAKETLRQEGIEGNVFTVAEIKGIERKEIVCWNIISDNINSWDSIVGLIDGKGDKPPENTNLYRLRYFFNMLYVALTRASENVILFEDMDWRFYDSLMGKIMIKENMDGIRLRLLEQASTPQELYDEAKRLETNEHYEDAVRMYKLSHTGDYAVAAERCSYLLDFCNGNYAKAARGLWKLREYDHAFLCYRADDDRNGIVRCEVIKGKPQREIMAEHGITQKQLHRIVFSDISDDLFSAYMATYVTYAEEEKDALRDICRGIREELGSMMEAQL